MLAVLFAGLIPFFPASISYADDRFTETVRSYSEFQGSITAMEETPDGSYYFAAYDNTTSILGRMDKNFEIKWITSFDNQRRINSLSPTSDGGVLFAGDSTDFHVIYGKLNVNGTVAFLKAALTDRYSASGTGIVEANDNEGTGILVSGVYRQDQGAPQIPFVFRAGPQGEITAETYMTDMLYNPTFTDMEPSGDGSYLLTGTIRSGSETTGLYQALLVMVGADTQVKWVKSFGTDLGSATGQSIRRTSDGGFVITGNILDSASKQRMFLLKSTTDGSLIWLRDYPLDVNSIGLSVRQTADGGYLVAGGDNYKTMILLKTSNSGEQQWVQTWSDSDAGYGNAFFCRTASGRTLFPRRRLRQISFFANVGR
ncbi:hypothetical protein AWM70_15790 [Paenibacillus yonginensis]|uniref:Bulb-type lectin domain-containing protein n=1 Tax=Paenibacillus yonginensis TaxID=1462996 RepID=A0A1B1N358_9BACL|nr:hypothetical protein [Paenibacillus yonginensis]ANS75868.1 hypothetical protein AWM70_15790 [Paenibacillus yonginensis]